VVSALYFIRIYPTPKMSTNLKYSHDYRKMVGTLASLRFTHPTSKLPHTPQHAAITHVKKTKFQGG